MPSLKIMNIIYSPCPLQHPDFWPSVFELLLVGRFQTLSDLLTSAIKSQSQSNKGIMIVIEQLSVIINQGYDHLSLGEISQMKFKVSTMVAHDPETNYHISKVNIALSILGGDTKYIIEYSQDKIQAFIMTLYYQYSEPKDIHTSATTFFSAYKTSSETGEILVYSSLLQNDIFKAFEYCAQYDWWLLSHLVDLFECKQALDRPITYERNGQRISAKCSDYFITFYASSIVKQYNLLDVAYAYWITCGEMGKQMLDEVMNVNESRIL
ncbi:nucleoporin Nup85-like protein [Pilobolus umbonatus]|nr:nucleoporin Nup85-like protein [Pilobolus umbonatus]